MLPAAPARLRLRYLNALFVLSTSSWVTGTVGGQTPDGAVRGRVLRDSTDLPVEGAEITLNGSWAVHSSVRGEFTLALIPVGTYWVQVRAIGFVPFGDSLRISGGSAQVVTYRLRTAPTVLAAVVVTAAERLRNTHLAEFEARRKYGFGKFLTRDDWKGRGAATLASILQSSVPGVTVTNNAVFSRRSFRACPMNTWIDGVRTRDVRLDQIWAMDVLAIEVYRSITETPLEFGSPGAQCGALVVWTGPPAR